MSSVVMGHHPTVRMVRRALLVRARTAAGRGYALARRLPVPASVRTRLRERLAWHRGLRWVPVDALLLGPQNHGSVAEFSRALGDPGWGSRPVAVGPHVDLLRPRVMSEAEILASSYATMARAAIRLDGQYFGAVDDAGIVGLARAFRSEPGPAPSVGRAPDVVHRSAPGTPVDVAPIADSACYQVLDGHHRIAAAVVAGQQQVPVRVRRIPVRTPLQEMLGAMSWIGGEPELYQPVPAPEVATWPTVRRCEDRLAAMLAWCDTTGMDPATASYLDVASCYGWFVAAMAERGFNAEGVEQDPVAPALGHLLHGLAPETVHTGEAVTFLRDADRQWDVVSCFSLLHHFVLGRSQDSAEDLVRALDRVTGRVLFLDTGEEHEAWFAQSLSGWGPQRITEFLAQHTSFDRVVNLGPDQDNQGAYRGNYGRHLFACVRTFDS